MQTLLLTLSLLLVGSLTAGCVVQSDPMPGPKGDQGAPGTNGLNGKDGKDAVLPPELEARLEAFENAAYCPRLIDNVGTLRAYTPDLTMPGVVRCTYGADEMVKVGAFWIDRYESILGSEEFYSNSSANTPPPFAGCDGTGIRFASNSDVDDYPQGFPDNGNWTTPVYACSVPGFIPSRHVTWFQAAQACSIVGKRLCTNAEWQTAVAGTADPGASSGASGTCRTDEFSPRPTGEGKTCRSNYGAEDMIGNLFEWVSDWVMSPGKDDLTYAGGGVWDMNYGSDGTYNIEGSAADPNYSMSGNGFGTRIPAALARGGNWGEKTRAGAFDIDVSAAPTYRSSSYGLRCCAGGK